MFIWMFILYKMLQGYLQPVILYKLVHKTTFKLFVLLIRGSLLEFSDWNVISKIFANFWFVLLQKLNLSLIRKKV